MRVIDDIHHAWDHLWFGQGSPRPLIIIRIGAGLLTVAWGAALGPDAASLFAARGATLARPGNPTWLLAHVVFHPGIATVISLLIVLAGFLLAIGRLPRSAALIAFLGVSALMASNPFLFNTGDWIFRSTLFILSVSPLHRTPGWRRSVTGAVTVPMYPVRLLQLILIVGYASSVMHKLQGSSWPSGTAVAGLAQYADMQRFATIPAFVTDRPWLVAAMTIGTLVIQALIPVFLLVPRLRWLGFLAGATLHLTIDVLLVIGFFAPVMLLLYLAFLTEPDLDRIRRLFRRPTIDKDVSPPSDGRDPARVLAAPSPGDAAG